MKGGVRWDGEGLGTYHSKLGLPWWSYMIRRSPGTRGWGRRARNERRGARGVEGWVQHPWWRDPVEEVVGHSMMSAAVEGKPRRDIAWMTFMENTTASPLSLV